MEQLIFHCYKHVATIKRLRLISGFKSLTVTAQTAAPPQLYCVRIKSEDPCQTRPRPWEITSQIIICSSNNSTELCVLVLELVLELRDKNMEPSIVLKLIRHEHAAVQGSGTEEMRRQSCKGLWNWWGKNIELSKVLELRKWEDGAVQGYETDEARTWSCPRFWERTWICWKFWNWGDENKELSKVLKLVTYEHVAVQCSETEKMSCPRFWNWENLEDRAV